MPSHRFHVFVTQATASLISQRNRCLVSACPWMFLPVLLLAGALSRTVQAFSLLGEPLQLQQQRKPRQSLLRWSAAAGHQSSGHCQIQQMPNAATAGEENRHDTGTGTISTTEEDDDPSSFVGAQQHYSLWLQLSYDGRRFDGGWDHDDDSAASTSTSSTNSSSPLDGRTRTRRSVRSVVQNNLAKLYGNLAPSRIKIQSTVPSLDPGVHAVGLVVQVFATIAVAAAMEGSAEEDDDMVSAYCNSNDTSILLPMPMSPDRVCRALNRMCQDVQIKAYSSYHAAAAGTGSSRNGFRHPIVFVSPHPRTSFVTTYSYRLSFGPRPDPIQRHYVWHIVLPRDDDDDNNVLTTTVPPMTNIIGQLQVACDRLVQQEQASRSSRSAVDRLDHMVVVSRPNDDDDHWHGSTTGGRCDVTITGRCLTDRTARAHVGQVVAAAVSAVSGSVTDHRNSTTTIATLFSTTMAPAHGLVLVNVQYDNSDNDNNNNHQDSWVWHAAKRYEGDLHACALFIDRGILDSV
jgi:tRNA U38,U39,U40 pseudouridine synthase TruA